MNGVHTRLRKFLLSVSDLSDDEQKEAGRWSEFGTGDVPTLGLAFPSIISDSEASWWGAPPQPLMARPCLEDGSEGIPPCTTTVGLSGRSCDLLLLYTTMLGTAIINARNYIAMQRRFMQDVSISMIDLRTIFWTKKYQVIARCDFSNLFFLRSYIHIIFVTKSFKSKFHYKRIHWETN